MLFLCYLSFLCAVVHGGSFIKLAISGSNQIGGFVGFSRKISTSASELRSYLRQKSLLVFQCPDSCTKCRTIRYKIFFVAIAEQNLIKAPRDKETKERLRELESTQWKCQT